VSPGGPRRSLDCPPRAKAIDPQRAGLYHRGLDLSILAISRERATFGCERTS
jgi:hypothetical protein